MKTAQVIAALRKRAAQSTGPGAALDVYAAERLEILARLDREAGTHVEIPICMRTKFTGNPPYVGWKGLGLALTEALDERDALRAEVERLKGGAR